MTTPVTARRRDAAAKHDRFVAYVERICRIDPGQRAALRSGRGRHPDRAHRMHAVMASWVSEDDPAIERAYYTVASLIAAQGRAARRAPETEDDKQPAEEPAPRVRMDLGTALGVAAGARDGGRAIAVGSAEKRLHLLVRQGLDGVHRHLPPIVGHLRAAGVPLDWAQLVEDLSGWRRRQDQIAKRWLHSFYRTVDAGSSTVDENEETQ